MEIHIRDVVRESLGPRNTKENRLDRDDLRMDVVNAGTLDADFVTRGVTRFKD